MTSVPKVSKRTVVGSGTGAAFAGNEGLWILELPPEIVQVGTLKSNWAGIMPA